MEELKENDIKAKAGGKSDVDWDRILEGIKVTAGKTRLLSVIEEYLKNVFSMTLNCVILDVPVCWMVAIGIATIKDLVMVGNMVSWYRYTPRYPVSLLSTTRLPPFSSSIPWPPPLSHDPSPPILLYPCEIEQSNSHE